MTLSQEMQKMATVERAIPLEEAEFRARTAIKELGLKPVLEEFDNNGDGPGAWNCDLIDANGHRPILGHGFGKGNRAAGTVGAIFEALEHLLDGPVYFNADEVFFRPASHFATGDLAAEASIPILSAARDQEVISCRYSSLHSDQQIDVPLYFVIAMVFGGLLSRHSRIYWR